MSKAKKKRIKAALFLHGRYPDSQSDFYEKLCRDRFLVAVDGGYSFFEKTKRKGLIPDLLIGDFDSLKPFPKDLSAKTEVQRYPTDKDKTDTHLALEYCLNLGAVEIDIVQPSVGDTDQFLGNLMLLNLPVLKGSAGKVPAVRVISHTQEIYLMRDGNLVLRKAVGDKVSVVPVSGSVVYTCRGCKYTADKAKLRAGETLALRNRVISDPAEFTIKGQAFLIRRYARKK